MGLGRSQSGLAAAGHRPAPVTGDGVSMPRAVPPVEATGDAPAPHRASARQAQPTGSRILGPLAEPGALAAGLVFGLLLCLYALTGGGQGYSVDGTFSYEVARSLATDPQLQFLRQNRETLKRWGPVAPALAVVPTRLGASLGAWAPRRDTLQLDGRTLQLYDFPVLGPPGTAASDAGGSASGVDELRLPLPEALHVSRVQLVSFLSLATEVGDGAPVAELTLRRATGDTVLGRAVVRAGQDTAEWAYDVPAAARPQHRRARLAGHWPGNPQANLYGATLALEPAPAGGLVPRAETLVVRYLAPQGRLHLRSIVVEPAATATGDAIALPGPPTWSAAQHAAQFTRFGFSFTNAWLMAATGALLVPLARVLGYTTGTGVTLALGFGVGTLAWPYAKLDFAEPAAGLFALASTVLVLYVTRRGARPRRARLWLVAAGGLAALGAGAKYTAVWFIPLLAAQLVLGAGASTAGAGGTGGAPWTRRGAWGARAITVGRELLPALAAFAAVPLVAMLGAVWLTGAAPALWTGWQQGLARGWLDFPLWEGLYGLLLSPGKGLFAYAPPLLLALAGLPFFLARHRAGALVIVAAPLVYLVVYGSKGVWHGGGWGPRYLVPALPFMAAWSLPLLARVLQAGRPSRTSWLRLGAAGLLLAGVGVQLLGVAKHPNRYTVMFRDHILPDLPDYGVALGGSHARAYWRHFGGPEAGRQLRRPPLDWAPPVAAPAGRVCSSALGVDQWCTAPATASQEDPPRGLGYLFAESGALELAVQVRREVALRATLYTCDWDHRNRRQEITIQDATSRRTYSLVDDFSSCVYLTWPVTVRPDHPLQVRVVASGADTAVLSGLFFDPALEGPPLDADGAAAQPMVDTATRGEWPGRYGQDGYLLFAWRRGGVDVGQLPAYVSAYRGASRVWIDTWETELGETASLYSLAFSPILAHAWLLGNDVIASLFPHDVALQQRALASPPWRYLAGLELHAPHPEYGLGIDFWPLLLWSEFRSHRGFMAAVWLVAAGLLLGAAACAAGLLALAPRLGAASGTGASARRAEAQE